MHLHRFLFHDDDGSGGDCFLFFIPIISTCTLLRRHKGQCDTDQMVHSHQREVAGAASRWRPGSPGFRASVRLHYSRSCTAQNVTARREPGRSLSQVAHFTDETQGRKVSCGGLTMGVVLDSCGSQLTLFVLCLLSIMHCMFELCNNTFEAGLCKVCN